MGIPNHLVSAALKDIPLCLHCQTPVSKQRAESLFCCNGCAVVYELLKVHSLTDYYELRQQVAGGKSPPLNLKSENYGYLDDPHLLKAFGVSAEQPRLSFYIEGIQCIACLWLIEKLPGLCPDVLQARLQYEESILQVELNPGGRFSTVARILHLLGYQPHPIRTDRDAVKYQQKDNRSCLSRIAIAGACTGNIMLFSIAIYSGASSEMIPVLAWASFILYLPVAIYCSLPFYQGAWRSFRAQTLSIDLPISLALILGSGISAWNLIQGGKLFYFDSLSALVFLLLSSRFFLKRLQQKSMSRTAFYTHLTPLRAWLWQPAAPPIEVSTEGLKPEDKVWIDRQSVIPCDGVLISCGYVSMGLLTGEPAPKYLAEGDLVFAGSVNEGEPITVKVKRVGDQSRLGKILKKVEIEQNTKAPIVGLTDQVSKGFLAGVLVLAALAFFVAPSTTEGMHRALALMIVTCPCALALATPLSLRVAMKRAADLGILIKNAEVLEGLRKIQNIFFDKTGTLTTGRFEVLSHFCLIDEISILRAVWVLENSSQHPIARALVAFIEDLIPREFLKAGSIKDFKEMPGSGLKGVLDGIGYEIRGIDDLQFEPSFHHPVEAIATRVGVFRNGLRVAEFSLGDTLREDSMSVIGQLASISRLSLFLLSGDCESCVEGVGRALGFKADHVFAQQSPEQKSALIKKHQNTLMIGEGANDSIALASANFGIAAQGALESSLRAANVVFTKPGIGHLPALIGISQAAYRTIYRNIFISVAYNLVGAIGAISGRITPLAAAILMPLSATTVFASSFWQPRGEKK